MARSRKLSKQVHSYLRNVFSWFENHSAFIVALATCALAFITYFHIDEAKNMRRETKRIADLSLEQFKIMAYPTFLVEFKEISLEADSIRQELRIVNKGEITAHSVSFLFSYAFEHKDRYLAFVNDLRAFYKEFGEEVNSLDFETKIWKNANKNFITKFEAPRDYSIDVLKNLLIYVRFKVPYDEIYQYEVFGFALKRVEENFAWQYISKEHQKNLVNRHIKTFDQVENQHSQALKTFFADYKKRGG